MGISERIEEKLDAIIKHLGIEGAAAGEASHTALTGTSPAGDAEVTGSEGWGDELDKAGFPWDARIHASSKEKVAAGTWKYKRGVEQSVKDSVENEFRDAGYGADNGDQGTGAGDAPAPTVAEQQPAVVSPQLAEQAAAAPSLPTSSLNLPLAPAPVVAPATPKVEMPEYVQGAEIDDSKLSHIATAVYAINGPDFYTKLTTLFQLKEGQAVTDIVNPEWRASFHRLATDPALWAQYGLA